MVASVKRSGFLRHGSTVLIFFAEKPSGDSRHKSIKIQEHDGNTSEFSLWNAQGKEADLTNGLRGGLSIV
jgi:hypothetical protein